MHTVDYTQDVTFPLKDRQRPFYSEQTELALSLSVLQDAVLTTKPVTESSYDDGDQTLRILKGFKVRTPCMALNDFCIRNDMTAVYKLVNEVDQVHNKMFTMTCTIADQTEFGVATSKKAAKQLAAQRMLEFLARRGERVFPNISDVDLALQVIDSLYERADGLEQPVPQASNTSDPSSNAVTQLHILCAKHHWPVPSFVYLEKTGPVHDPTYTVEVSVGKLSQRGQGKSKKIARRSAAQALLSSWASLTLTDGHTEQAIVDEETLSQDILRSLLRPSPVATSKLSCEQLQRIKHAIVEIDSEVESTGKYVEALTTVGREVGLEARYSMTNNASTGDKQCVLQLATLPLAVCIGTGCTAEQAKFDAAKQGLLYLKALGSA